MLMDDLVETMREAPGVGLAAPQVRVGLRIVVVETPIDLEDPDAGARLHTLADPEIVWASDAVEDGQEACLSVPDLYGEVERSLAIRVRALDRSGRRVEFDAEGFEARVLQHEIDHLDGILFPDRVTALEKLFHIRENAEGELVRVPYTAPALV